MGIAYGLQFLDKMALSAATLLGILDPKTGIVSSHGYEVLHREL